MRRMNRSKIQAILGVTSVMLVLLISTLSTHSASSIAQSFRTDDSGIVVGALVSLKSDDANTVELATPENLSRILGVVGQNSLIELSGNKGSVKVVTTGEAAILVSDINGAVKTGDKITASPIAGVGMRVTTNMLAIGTAQANLSGVETEPRTITDKAGKEKQIHVGAIQMQVDKGFFEVPQSQHDYVPLALQNLADSIVGHPVSPLRVLLAAFLTIFVFVTIIVLLYTSVRSGIISIGRNPLSENAVHKSMLQVGLTVFGVLIFAVITVYFLLTT